MRVSGRWQPREGWRSKRFARVSRAHPCLICGKPDWCLRSPDGRFAICPRTPSLRRAGDAGFLHRVDGQPLPVVTNAPVTIGKLSTAELDRLVARHQADLSAARLASLARQFGLCIASLQQIGAGWSWDHEAYSFPMRSAAGNTIGIRLRRPSGRKFCVTGSRTGLFIPADLDTDTRLLVAEGESDTAALLDLGFAVIGRPGCANGIDLITAFCRRHDVQDVVVVADQGTPGQRGAAQLASRLRLHCQCVCVMTPPADDARAWRQQGATSEQVLQLIQKGCQE